MEANILSIVPTMFGKDYQGEGPCYDNALLALLPPRPSHLLSRGLFVQ